MAQLFWDALRVLTYASLVPIVYVIRPSLQVSVALLVGLSIAAPLESAVQALLASWREWRGHHSEKIVTTDDRLDELTAAVERLTRSVYAGVLTAHRAARRPPEP